MSKKIILLVFIIFSKNISSQEIFKKGYFNNNNGEKIDCLILDEDWKNNPEIITYKIKENSKQIKGLMNNISEFGFDNIKYKRAFVKIDISSTKTSTLSKSKEPKFEDKTVFLKFLVEGKANLYVYQNNNARLFFFNIIGNKSIDQLVYKKYYKSATVVKENNQYKQQISTNLNCDNNKLEEFTKLNYNTTSLIKYFIKYNTCDNSNYENTILNKKHSVDFNLTIKPSVNFSSLSTENKANSLGELNFGNNVNFGIGIETEFVLPFSNKNISLVFEPTFQSYNSNIENYAYVETNIDDKTTYVSIEYKAIDLLFGIKYYFPITDASKIYINALYNFNSIDLGSNFNFETTSLVDLGLKANSYLAFGLGYKYNNKICLEGRISSSQGIITNSLYSTNYPRTSIIIGYNLF